RPVKDLRDRVVWLISGEGSPKRYYLRERFVPDETGPAVEPGFKYFVRAMHGKRMRIRIDGEPWFDRFLSSQGNFGFGFNRVKPQFIPCLETVAEGGS